MKNLLVSPTVNTKKTTVSLFNKKNKPLFLSPITQKDRLLLQKRLLLIEPDSQNYEHSWGYVTQSTRYGRIKWHDPDTGSLFFIGRKSETDPTLVIPTVFATPEYLAKAIGSLQDYSGTKKTVIKNVNKKDISTYEQYGFRQYEDHEGWNTYARFDDQTFPQLIVDINKMIAKKGRCYKKLRTALNKKNTLTIREYQSSDKEDILRLFAIRDGNSEDTAEQLHGMYYASHAMYPEAELDKRVILDKESTIIGFIATSDITPKTAALVALIFNPQVKHASIWGIYNTVLALKEKHITKLNLGGCEAEGTYNFMRRTFCPIAQIEKTHMVYDP